MFARNCGWPSSILLYNRPSFIYLLFSMKALVLLAQQKLLWIQLSRKYIVLLYWLALFLLPLVLAWPQLLVGTMVNILLITVAIRYKSYKILIPFVMLPSIAAILHGALFGAFSVFLVYMMPAIWIGNFLLVYTIQHNKQLISWILTGGLYKSIFLAIFAYILIYLWTLPIIFLKAMWFYQLVSVLIAWIIVLSFQKLTEK